MLTRNSRCAECVTLRTAGQTLDYGLLGNADRTTTAGFYYPGVTFLLRDEFERTATVFAFKVCYRNPTPVRLQIWRPTQTANNTYRLMAEVIHKSESERSSLPTLEEVRLIRFVLMVSYCTKLTQI